MARAKKDEWASAGLKIYPSLHKRLKVQAAERGMTIGDLIQIMEQWYNKTHPKEEEKSKK